MEERSLIHTDETLEFACVVKTICDEYDVTPEVLRIFPPADHVLSLSNQVRFKKQIVIKIPLPARIAPKTLSADPHLRLSTLRAVAPDAHSLYTSTNDNSQLGKLDLGLGEFELTKSDKKIRFWVWKGAQDYYMHGGQNAYFVHKDDVLALTFFIKRAQRLNRRPVDTPILPSEMITEIYKNSVGFLLKGRDMREKYVKFRIPYKRGVLLSGRPGCVTGDTKIRIRKKSNKGTHKIQQNRDYSSSRTPEYRTKMSQITSGQNNPMYGKNIYDIWVEKYGGDEADKRVASLSKKRSKNMMGEKNPMYGKPPPKGSGNGWGGWYKGWYFRSLKELSYMIYVIEPNSYKWENAEQKRLSIPYVDHLGHNRTYRADFLLNDHILIEVKPKALMETVVNQLKKVAAELFCSNSGYEYRMVDVKTIEYKALRSLCASGVVKLSDPIRLERIKNNGN